MNWSLQEPLPLGLGSPGLISHRPGSISRVQALQTTEWGKEASSSVGDRLGVCPCLVSALETNYTLKDLPAFSETAPRHRPGNPGWKPQEGMPSGAEVVSMATRREALTMGQHILTARWASCTHRAYSLERDK